MSAGQKDRDLYNPDIDWLINVAPSELGFSGTLEGTVSMLELGGMPTGLPDTTPFTERQLGFGCAESIPERWRQCFGAWRLLSPETQGILLAHYSSRNDLPTTQRVALDGQLGKLWRAALWVLPVETVAKLIDACVDKGKEGRMGTIEAAIKRATRSVSEAHRSWEVFSKLQREANDAAELRYIPPLNIPRDPEPKGVM